MTIEKRIKLNQSYYFVGMELKYDEDKRLHKSDHTFFDYADTVDLMTDLESFYLSRTYYDNVPYMNDILYIYSKVPFLSYVRDVTYDENNDQIIEEGVIFRNEIDNYIKCHGIKIKNA